jgi:hypothetical protein
MRYEVRPSADGGGYGVWDTRRSGWVKDGNGQHCGMHPTDAAALAGVLEAGGAVLVDKPIADPDAED